MNIQIVSNPYGHTGIADAVFLQEAKDHREHRIRSWETDVAGIEAAGMICRQDFAAVTEYVFNHDQAILHVRLERRAHGTPWPAEYVRPALERAWADGRLIAWVRSVLLASYDAASAFEREMARTRDLLDLYPVELIRRARQLERLARGHAEGCPSCGSVLTFEGYCGCSRVGG